MIVDHTNYFFDEVPLADAMDDAGSSGIVPLSWGRGEPTDIFVKLTGNSSTDGVITIVLAWVVTPGDPPTVEAEERYSATVEQLARGFTFTPGGLQALDNDNWVLYLVEESGTIPDEGTVSAMVVPDSQTAR